MLEDIDVSPFKTHAVAAYSCIQHGKKILQQSNFIFCEKHHCHKVNLANLLAVNERELDSFNDEEKNIKKSK